MDVLVRVQTLEDRPAFFERLGEGFEGLARRDDPLPVLVIEASLGGAAGEALATGLLAIASAGD